MVQRNGKGVRSRIPGNGDRPAVTQRDRRLSAGHRALGVQQHILLRIRRDAQRLVVEGGIGDIAEEPAAGDDHLGRRRRGGCGLLLARFGLCRLLHRLIVGQGSGDEFRIVDPLRGWCRAYIGARLKGARGLARVAAGEA